MGVFDGLRVQAIQRHGRGNGERITRQPKGGEGEEEGEGEGEGDRGIERNGEEEEEEERKEAVVSSQSLRGSWDFRGKASGGTTGGIWHDRTRRRRWKDGRGMRVFPSPEGFL